ncbi:MAG: hypothetical protein FOGNACKC_05317 [Anaerolineae bacterium]|nr:hypothetical protein [Anaerolineae bacterium]
MIEKINRQPVTTKSPVRPLALFSRRWLPSTLLVLMGMAVLVRLGFWQLDRLEQRRAHNAQLAAQLAQPPLELTGAAGLPANVADLKNRRIVARGEFDFERQIGLKAQTWQGEPGIHLVTPLRLASGEAVLVDRGWVPVDESAPAQWPQFNETGPATITGHVRLSDTLPNARPPDGPQQEWYRVDIEAIAPQLPYPILPIYVQQLPPANNSAYPARLTPEVDMSEGPHLGYAVQWFLFALILGGGYIHVFRKESAKTK